MCDADADQFETVSDEQYPCKRDCDLFAIDEYLDQCSAIFPSAIEAVTAVIDGVSASVQEMADADIPAVTARVEANEGAVTTINDELESVRLLIDALGDIDTATNASIVGVTAIAESNVVALSSLEQRVALLEARVDGFGASSAKSAAAAAQMDADGAASEVFGAQSAWSIGQFKDELVGALVASNILVMVGFTCFVMAGRCNRRKYVVLSQKALDENENMSF